MQMISPLRRLIDGLSRRFPHIRVLGMISSSNMLANLLQLASIPVIARLYGEADLGRLAVYYLSSQIIAIAISGRLEQGLFVVKSKRRSGYIALLLLLAVCTFVAAGIAAALIAFAALDRPMITIGGLGFDRLTAVLFVGQIGLNSSVNVARAWTIRNARYAGFSRATVSKAVFYVAMRLGAGLAGMGFLGLMLTELVGGLVMSLGLLLAVRREIPLWRVRAGVTAAKRGLRKLWRFPVLEMPSAFLDSFAQSVPALFISSHYGFVATGQYYMAYQLLSVPISQIGTPISDIFQNEIARLQRADILPSLRVVFLRFRRFLLALGAAIFLTAMLLGPWIFPLLLGAQWAQAGLVASILSPWLYAGFVVGSLSRIFSVFSRQHVKLYYDLACLGAMALGAAAIILFKLDFMVGVAIFSLANIVCYLWYHALIQRLVRQLAG